MGRPRSFDTGLVVSAARDAFVRSGYVGTSVDDLLDATGLQRASLYSAFGSKRGLFVAALHHHLSATTDLDLLLVASMDASRDDDEVREIVGRAVERLGTGAPALLGTRLLARARVRPQRIEGEGQ